MDIRCIMVGDEKFVLFYELIIEALGKDKASYYYQIRRFLTQNPCARENIDYRPYNPISPPRKGQPVRHYLITIPIAKAICFNQRSKTASQILLNLETAYEKVA